MTIVTETKCANYFVTTICFILFILLVEVRAESNIPKLPKPEIHHISAINLQQTAPKEIITSKYNQQQVLQISSDTNKFRRQKRANEEHSPTLCKIVGDSCEKIEEPGTPKCEISNIGKPAYHGFTYQTYGSWMKDPVPTDDFGKHKVWMTSESDPTILFEFENKTLFRRNETSKIYTLPIPFQGNSHVVFNGSFYYQANGKANIIRFFLNNQTSLKLDLDISILINDKPNYLYTTNNNIFDFNVDESQLWVIFPIENVNTGILKINVNDMKIQDSFKINFNNHEVGEMFITCGVLYGINDVTKRNTTIKFALDLHHGKLLNVNLDFTVPFRKATMIGYDQNNKELYSLDNGNVLTYPIHFKG